MQDPSVCARTPFSMFHSNFYLFLFIIILFYYIPLTLRIYLPIDQHHSLSSIFAQLKLDPNIILWAMRNQASGASLDGQQA